MTLIRSRSEVQCFRIRNCSSITCLLIIFTLCIAIINSREMSAQTAFGTVVGTVSDPTGAAMPNVQVTLTNKGTNEVRQDQTDHVGNYQFLNVPVGSYKLDFTTPGFQHFTLANVDIQLQGTTRANASMHPGQVTETIEVSAEAQQLDTDSGSLSTVIEGRAVKEMPLNGRNVQNLIALTPGVIPQGSTSGAVVGNQGGGVDFNPQAWGNYQVAGAIANQGAQSLDGAPVNNLYINMVSIVPTQDAIQEFRVTTSETGADVGRTAGGAIDFTIKSGTNQFHGALWEYIRNKSFNANTFFNNRNVVPRPQYTQNQFGLTFGGPILRNKTFFFGSWEGFYFSLATPVTTTNPTDAMKSGDFSAIQPVIYDPLTTCGTGSNPACSVVNGKTVITRSAFPNNKIPTSRIDASAASMTYMWREPNRPGLSTATGPSQNLVVNAPGGGNHNQYNARVDHRLTAHDQLFARYTYWNIYQKSADYQGSMTALPPESLYTHQGVLGETHTFNPSTFLDVRISYLRNHFGFTPFHVDLCKFGPAYCSLPTTYPDLPVLNVSGLAAFSGGLRNDSTANNYVISANVSKVIGRHSLKFGVDSRRMEWMFIQINGDSGTFAFNNGFTAQDPTSTDTTKGYGFASFLRIHSYWQYCSASPHNRTSVLQRFVRARCLPGIS